MIISGAKKDDITNELLAAAFYNFQETSVFISLLPNDQNRNYYSDLFTIDQDKMHLLVCLGNRKMFIETCLEAKEFDSSISLLKYLEIGTRSWSYFIKTKRIIQGLFIETYCVTFLTCIEHPNSVYSFRIGQIIETPLITIQIHFLKEKAIFDELEHVHEFFPAERTRDEVKE